jgi:hypothetical protein
MPSPARVQLIPGDNPVVCATQGGDLVLGAIVAVGAG